MKPVDTSPQVQNLKTLREAKPETRNNVELLKKAREFETAFVAQMLSHSGLAKALNANSGFGGEAFSSLLVEQYAGQIVDRGGFGLADKIYEQLRDKEVQNVDKTVA